MIFIETPIFTKEIQKYLSDDGLRNMQSALLLRPEAGDLIPGSGGLRKLRWAGGGKGKRGGLRIIYYIDYPETIYLLFPYKKSKKEEKRKK